MSELAAGWGWPLNARKAHYFPEGDSVSLCRRWMFTGPRERSKFASKDDCAACTKLRPEVA